MLTCCVTVGVEIQELFLLKSWWFHEVRTLWRPVKFVHTKLAHPCLYGPCLCTGAQSCWNRKGPSPNCSHKVGSMKLSKICWC
ncbi:hypothetical protein AOLI_G00016060 [Acnodon oligacanthus]